MPTYLGKSKWKILDYIVNTGLLSPMHTLIFKMNVVVTFFGDFFCSFLFPGINFTLWTKSLSAVILMFFYTSQFRLQFDQLNWCLLNVCLVYYLFYYVDVFYAVQQ